MNNNFNDNFQNNGNQNTFFNDNMNDDNFNNSQNINNNMTSNTNQNMNNMSNNVTNNQNTNMNNNFYNNQTSNKIGNKIQLQKIVTKKNLKIAGIVVGVILVLIIISKLFGGNSSSTNNGYTAKAGDTLKVEEPIYQFDLKATSGLKTYTGKDLYDNTIEMIKLNVLVKNNYEDDLNMYLVYFYLTDSSKKALISSSVLNTQDDSLNDADLNITSNSTQEGSIYFDGDDKDLTDIISKAKYLQVSVVSNITENSGAGYDYERDDYYLALN